MSNKNILKQESGFTLIELLLTSVILLILGGLSIGAYFVYKESAEYSKGEVALRTARTAISAGELELPDGFNLPFTTSLTDGSLLAGAMAQALPGAVVPVDVRLGAEVSACDERSEPLDRASLLVSEPCRANQQVRWQKFCGGIEILTQHVTNDSPCS